MGMCVCVCYCMSSHMDPVLSVKQVLLVFGFIILRHLPDGHALNNEMCHQLQPEKTKATLY